MVSQFSLVFFFSSFIIHNDAKFTYCIFFLWVPFDLSATGFSSDKLDDARFCFCYAAVWMIHCPSLMALDNFPFWFFNCCDHPLNFCCSWPEMLLWPISAVVKLGCSSGEGVVCPNEIPVMGCINLSTV